MVESFGRAGAFKYPRSRLLPVMSEVSIGLKEKLTTETTTRSRSADV